MKIRFFNFVLVGGLLSAGSAFVLAQQPANRLGARFDQAPSERVQQREQFRNAVAGSGGTYYLSTRLAAGETGSRVDEDPGLPLYSVGQREFDQPAGLPPAKQLFGSNSGSSRAQHSSASAAPRVRNVAYDPPQENNSFGGGFSPTAEPQAGTSFGQTSSDDEIDVQSCALKFIDDIELPAQEAGQIKTLNVKEGDAVVAGQAIGRIDDEIFLRMMQQAQLRYEIAEKKATDMTSITAAENEIKLQEIIYNRTRDLNSKGHAPTADLDEAKFRLKLAMLKLQAAQNEIDSANGEARVEMARLKEVEAHIQRHAMSVDFNGYVIEIAKHPLEWVNAGEPVMRIARMDRLQVSGIVDANQVNAYQLVNRKVTVTANLAKGKTENFEGKIVSVGMERGTSFHLSVKAEIDNRPIEGHWVLQPGATVSMHVHLNEAAPTTAGGVTTMPQR